MKYKFEIQEFQPDGAHAGYVRMLDSSEMSILFHSIADTWSSSVNISLDGQQLLISFSGGKCAIMAALGDNEFYDFVGDPGAAGWLEFVHGGQPAEHPRRHCVPLSMATKVAERFLNGSGIDPCNGSWEKQGKWQSA